MALSFSDFVIYADESGDHSLVKIDPQYPVFVLTLCVFRKHHYVSRVVPSIQRLKFKWFGNDTVVLHEREIRKQERPFEFLTDLSKRTEFMADLDAALSRASFRIFTSVIDKRPLKEEYLFHGNPYSLGLQFCLEKIYEFLLKNEQVDRITHCNFECRGRKEDNELELEFLRIVGGENRFRTPLNCFKIQLVDKKANSAGLQIADLTARPIGIKTLRPDQSNRAFDIIEKKLFRNSRGQGPIRGLKSFP